MGKFKQNLIDKMDERMNQSDSEIPSSYYEHIIVSLKKEVKDLKSEIKVYRDAIHKLITEKYEVK